VDDLGAFTVPFARDVRNVRAEHRYGIVGGYGLDLKQ
jgi:hypothetical protein